MAPTAVCASFLALAAPFAACCADARRARPGGQQRHSAVRALRRAFTRHRLAQQAHPRVERTPRWIPS
eukprot:214716-Alexandrium_andersonii.AAC.1